jgi:hypothetical protein
MKSLLFKYYVLCSLGLGFMILNFPSPLLQMADDFLFMCMVLWVVSRARQRQYDFPSLYHAFWVFVVTASVISILNENTIQSIVLTLRQYKNVFLIFLISFSVGIDQSFVRKLIFYMLAISVPMAIFQFLTSDDFDKITGVFGFGGSGILSLMIVFYLSTEIAFRLRDNRPLFDYYLILFLPCLLNETKITFLILPIVLFVCVFKIGKINFVSGAVGGGILLILIPLVDYVYSSMYGYKYTDMLNYNFFESYLLTEDEFDIGRFERVIVAYEYVCNQNFFIMLFGEGLGSTFVGLASGVYGNVAEKFINTGLNEGSRIQLFHFIIEFGIVGTLLFYFLVLFLFMKAMFSNDKTDVVISSVAVMVIVLVGTLYQNILISREFSFLFFYYLFMAGGNLRDRAKI